MTATTGTTLADLDPKLADLISYSWRVMSENGEPLPPIHEMIESLTPALAASAAFTNDCHAPDSGKFCETPGGAGERAIPVKPGRNEDEEFERAAALEKHYGRKEMAPEMGGPQWAYSGQSPVITEAAEDVLQGQPYDPFDRYTSYGKDGYTTAETILTTIQDESSDVTLYSGHHRSRDEVEAIVNQGVTFPLVATSPDIRLAELYAGKGSKAVPAVLFEFPKGSQAGFYQANEHIGTGEYEVTDHTWNDAQTKVNITLRQTKRNTVPEKIYPDDEEE